MRRRAQLIAQAVGTSGAVALRRAVVAVVLGSMKFMCSHDMVRANARSRTGGSTLKLATHKSVARIAGASGAAGVPAANRALSMVVCLAGDRGLSRWSIEEIIVEKNVQREMEKSRPSIVTRIAAQSIARDIGKSLVHVPRLVAMESRFGSIMSHARNHVVADLVKNLTCALNREAAETGFAQLIVLVDSRSGRHVVLIVVVALSNGSSSSRRWPKMGAWLAVTDTLMRRHAIATRSRVPKDASAGGVFTANVMPCALEAESTARTLSPNMRLVEVKDVRRPMVLRALHRATHTLALSDSFAQSREFARSLMVQQQFQRWQRRCRRSWHYNMACK